MGLLELVAVHPESGRFVARPVTNDWFLRSGCDRSASEQVVEGDGLDHGASDGTTCRTSSCRESGQKLLERRRVSTGRNCEGSASVRAGLFLVKHHDLGEGMVGPKNWILGKDEARRGGVVVRHGREGGSVLPFDHESVCENG
ncbi:unannotated protein [freshwater metagenome]|uniref:Unannotated protein n=1 Tax=freshwater metagenome TaxID=449393 RepID=A0A6J6ELN6_9ZZZZ